MDTYPTSSVYDVGAALTSLAVGEAIVTVLSPEGVPTAVAWTRLYPPESRMAPASPQTIRELLVGSQLQGRYAHEVDPESAYERRTERMREAAERPGTERDTERSEAATRGWGARSGDQTDQLMEFGKVAMRFMRTPTGRQIQRSLFGVLRRR